MLTPPGCCDSARTCGDGRGGVAAAAVTCVRPRRTVGRYRGDVVADRRGRSWRHRPGNRIVHGSESGPDELRISHGLRDETSSFVGERLRAAQQKSDFIFRAVGSRGHFTDPSGVAWNLGETFSNYARVIASRRPRERVRALASVDRDRAKSLHCRSRPGRNPAARTRVCYVRGGSQASVGARTRTNQGSETAVTPSPKRRA